MADGFTCYINGTDYDAVNGMNYNFVVDVRAIGASGSVTYNYGGFTISACLVGGNVTSGSSQQTGTVTVSGQTVSWSGVVGPAPKIVVFATPTTIANYEGFVYNDYTKNPPVFKLAPPFTPMSLTQVIDLVPGYNQVVQTIVPYGQPFVAFHRCMEGSGFNHVIWTEVNQNGYWSLQFRNLQNGSLAMLTTRVYIFSKVMVNVPNAGFFMYNNGAIVWHNNCLPLAMSVGARNSASPLAITAGGSVLVNVPYDPTYPYQGQQRFNCYSAGISGGQYSASGADLYAVSEYNVPTTSPVPPGSSMGPPGVIDTAIYDTYYRQALGV